MEADSRVEFSLPARGRERPARPPRARRPGRGARDGPPAIADLKTVVTEACMNVVVHAYDEEQPGRWRSSAGPSDDGLMVVVRDFGAGIRPLRRRRAPQPAPRAAADRRALAELRDQRRARPGHRGADDGAARATNGAEPVAGARDRRRDRGSTSAAGELLAPVLVTGDLDVRRPRRPLGRPALRRGPAQRRDLGRRRRSGFPDGTARIASPSGTARSSCGSGRWTTGGGERLLDGMRIPGRRLAGALADEIQRRGDERRRAAGRSGSAGSRLSRLESRRSPLGRGARGACRAPGAGSARRASASSRSARRSSTGSCPRRTAAAGPRARSRRGRRRAASIAARSSTSSKPGSSSPIRSAIGASSPGSSRPGGWSSESGRRAPFASNASSTSASVDLEQLGDLGDRRRALELVAELRDRALDRADPLLQAARHAHRPDAVAEVALQLAEDRRRRRRRRTARRARGRSARSPRRGRGSRPGAGRRSARAAA